MLPTQHRMRRSADFQQTVRSGARAGRESLVVHMMTRTDPGSGPVVGFVVSKAVGNAVARNRVKRRLRAAVQGHLTEMPREVGIVVRALPPSVGRTFAELEADLLGAIRTAGRRRGSR